MQQIYKQASFFGIGSIEGRLCQSMWNTSFFVQVVNAARVLAARPRSKAAQENMDVFKDAWEKQVRLLTESVDDITTIHDFLAVSGGPESGFTISLNKGCVAIFFVGLK